MSTNIDKLKEELGADFGSLVATRKKKNPYLATSANGLSMAYGRSKEEALQNLIIGIAARRRHHA